MGRENPQNLEPIAKMQRRVRENAQNLEPSAAQGPLQAARRCARQAEVSGLSALFPEGSKFSALTPNPLGLMRLPQNLLGLMRPSPNPLRG